jgi:Cofactor assembly of complex C subunit B
MSQVVSTTKSSTFPLQAIPPEFSHGVLDSVSTLLSDSSVPEAGGVSYSKASYYTVLGLYLFSFPGLWSTIKRSTTAKIKRKTYVT